jgi:hypothetical protein
MDEPLPDGPLRIPDDLLVHILSFVPAPQRIAARAVSKRWLGVIDAAPLLWRDLPREPAIRKLGALCIDGDLEKVQRFVLRLGLTGYDSTACGNAALGGATYGTGGTDRLQLVRWLVETFKITAESIRLNNWVLARACHRGHVHVAQWVVATFGISTGGHNPAASRRHTGGCLLLDACDRGHLLVAMWLVEAFDLTADDARMQDNYALRRACINGHLPTASWLADRFSLTVDDVRCVTMLIANRFGHLDVVSWLSSRFEIPVSGTA